MFMNIQNFLPTAKNMSWLCTIVMLLLVFASCRKLKIDPDYGKGNGTVSAEMVLRWN